VGGVAGVRRRDRRGRDRVRLARPTVDGSVCSHVRDPVSTAKDATIYGVVVAIAALYGVVIMRRFSTPEVVDGPHLALRTHLMRRSSRAAPAFSRTRPGRCSERTLSGSSSGVPRSRRGEKSEKASAVAEQREHPTHPRRSSSVCAIDQNLSVRRKVAPLIGAGVLAAGVLVVLALGSIAYGQASEAAMTSCGSVPNEIRKGAGG
jgi:hypothetical protein